MTDYPTVENNRNLTRSAKLGPVSQTTCERWQVEIDLRRLDLQCHRSKSAKAPGPLQVFTRKYSFLRRVPLASQYLRNWPGLSQLHQFGGCRGGGPFRLQPTCHDWKHWHSQHLLQMGTTSSSHKRRSSQSSMVEFSSNQPVNCHQWMEWIGQKQYSSYTESDVQRKLVSIQVDLKNKNDKLSGCQQLYTAGYICIYNWTFSETPAKT